MMLALHGREAQVDAFRFVLAEKLGKTVAEMEATMTSYEYIQWQAFHTARSAIESVSHG